jgi:hypothetical protein
VLIRWSELPKLATSSLEADGTGLRHKGLHDILRFGMRIYITLLSDSIFHERLGALDMVAVIVRVNDGGYRFLAQFTELRHYSLGSFIAFHAIHYP